MTTQERDHRDPELDALMARLAAGRLMRANAPADPHFCCADCHAQTPQADRWAGWRCPPCGEARERGRPAPTAPENA